MLRARIDALATACGSALEAAAIDALERFAVLVTTWNERLDLTSARQEHDLVEVLFADALVLRDRALLPEATSVLDVGTGVGAPAIPLAIVRPDLRLTLLEPRRKRVAFLRTAIGTLELAARVRAVEGRIEPTRPQPPAGDPFDVASARATFAPDRWLRIGLALAPACLLFAVDRIPPGAAYEVRYVLPFSGARRVLARYVR